MPFIFVNIVHIYRVSIRVRVRVRVRVRASVRVRVRVSVRLKVSITSQNTMIMVAFYIMFARPVGIFFTVLWMNFPVMLIAEDICADIGIGLASLVCSYL